MLEIKIINNCKCLFYNNKQLKCKFKPTDFKKDFNANVVNEIKQVLQQIGNENNIPLNEVDHFTKQFLKGYQY
jgi:hypothetical protein